MSVCSFPFLLACSIATILFHLLPWKSLRRLYFLVLNAAFLVTLVPNRTSWIYFSGFLAATYLMLRFLKAKPSRDHLYSMLVLLVGGFIYLKRYDFLNLILARELSPESVLVGVELVGLSYILFKAIHMAIDQLDGQLAPYTFFSYLNYQIAFFTLVAGPIQRYNDFYEGWSEMGREPRDNRETLRQWSRILTGMLQMGLVSTLLWEVHERAPFSNNPWIEMIGRFYVYPLFLYFNFAGYTNIAIGAGALFGFRVPENFNYPFIARNLIDFWNRWHMSLSRWIRDYVFMMPYKACVERWPGSARWTGYLLLFVALFIAGIWHGTTSNYVVFGVILGIGVMGTQIWGDLLKGLFGHAGLKRYMQNRFFHALAIVVTFHYVCLSFLFVAGSTTSGITVVRRGLELAAQLFRTSPAALWNVQTAYVLAFLAAGAVIWWKLEWLTATAKRAAAWLPQKLAILYATLWAKAGVTAFILLLLWAWQQKDPVVVYMRF